MVKRYLPFYKAGAINMLAYKFNLFIWLIVSVLEVACVIFLWFAVYSNSPEGMEAVINGYSFKEMITYLVTVNIFWFCTSNSNTLWSIDDEIKNGTIAMAFTKPISYRKRFIFTTLGVASMQFALVGLPLFTIAYTVFVLIGFIEIASVGVFLIDILLFLVSTMIAVLLMDCVNYIFGVLCFYTSSSFGVNSIKEVIVSFLSGTLLPIAFFPSVFSTILSYLPFAGMSQNPVRILLMQIPITEGLKAIGLSLLWLIVLESAAKGLFCHASKKITVQGG